MSPCQAPLDPSKLGTVVALWILLGCAAVLAAEGDHPEGLQPSEILSTEALAHELAGLDGERVALGDLWGQTGALLVFTSNTCPYSIDWQDRFPELAADATAKGVAFVLINANARKRGSDDSPESMAALAEEQGWSFGYWIDEGSGLADLLGAQRTPEVFLFDGDRKLVYRGAPDDHSGPLENVTHHWAADALDQLIGGEEITTPSSPALGCKILRPRRPRS